MEKEKGCAKCYYVKKGISFYLIVFSYGYGYIKVCQFKYSSCF